MRQSTVLIIDDDGADVELIRRQLQQVPDHQFDVVHTANGVDALHMLQQELIDVIVVDYMLGAETGLQVVQTLRAAGETRPVVVLTGQGDEYIAVELAQAGADQYLVKSDVTPALLQTVFAEAEARSLRRQSERRQATIRDRFETELVETCRELAHKSSIDALTRMLNRGSWYETAQLEHERAVRTSKPYGLIMIDVDHFKLLNDSLGHQAGDECLRKVGACLSRECRSYDIVGRYGGEEFVVLAPMVGPAELHALAERIRASVADLRVKHPGNPHGDFVTVSVGVTFGPMASLEGAIKLADEALYQAKQNGRDQVCTTERTGRSSEDADFHEVARVPRSF